MRPARVGLIGDFDAAVTAHRAIPLALAERTHPLVTAFARAALATRVAAPRA